MATELPLGDPERFPLRRRGREIVLLRAGLRHPRSMLFGGDTFTPYEEITHLAPAARWLRIGTRRGVYLFPGNAFQQPAQAQGLVRALLARIAGGPRASKQLERMAEVEERYRSPASLRATRWLVVLCVAIYALELALGPLLIEVAQFSTTLAPVEPWRFATGNLLHDAWLPVHLLANAIAILVFGPLVERPLGARATFFVMAISGLAAMGGSALAGYERVVGASGIASGLVGAVLWLEFRQPDRLPASWRLPRRIFVTLLVIDASITSLVPWIATGGHLGGFAGGALAAGLVAGPVLRGLPQPAWLTLGNVLLALVYLASVGAVGFELAASDGIMARRGTRLLELGSAPPELLNDTAWWIATEPEPSDAALTTALELAERAVNATERGDPNILDTLAEVLFLLGRKAESIAAIDEAIDLEPRERYFREQRRRFTGDRPFDDRPVPPGFTPPLEVEPDPGIRV